MSEQAFTPEAALALKEQVDERVRRDRQRAESDAFPLGLFGVVSLVAAVIAASGHSVALGIYWAIAGPVGGALIGWHHRRHELRIRFERPPAVVMIVTAAGLALGATVLGWTGGAEAAFFAVGSGYVVFSALTANPSSSEWRSQSCSAPGSRRSRRGPASWASRRPRGRSSSPPWSASRSSRGPRSSIAAPREAGGHDPRGRQAPAAHDRLTRGNHPRARQPGATTPCDSACSPSRPPSRSAPLPTPRRPSG